MRKTSLYARKRLHLGPIVTFNAAAWQNTIALHRPYDEPTDAAGIEGTADTADRCEMLVRAIERYKKSQAWGVDGLGRADLPDAIEIYASVLRASSPAQMDAATKIRMQVLGLRKQ